MAEMDQQKVCKRLAIDIHSKGMFENLLHFKKIMGGLTNFALKQGLRQDSEAATITTWRITFYLSYLPILKTATYPSK